MRRVALGVAIMAVAGCGQPQSMTQPTVEKLTTLDVAEPAQTAAPQIAYSYALSYRLNGDDIAPAQARHVALCRRLGPARCFVTKTDLTRDDANGTNAAATALLVDARIAVEFGRGLDAVVSEAGGEVASRRTAAEDVTKQVIETDARIRAKQALADRLLRLIGTSNARVGDLIAAEKAFAEVQTELEAARGVQAELRRRVAMSEIAVDYASTAATGRWSPVGQALHNAGATLAVSLAGLVTFLVAAAPWALALAGIVWLLRRIGWRWPFRRRRAVDLA